MISRPSSLRILVTGSRDWSDPDLLGKVLYEVINDSGADEFTIVHGKCPRGADQMTTEFCESEAAWFDNIGQVLAEEPHPAIWDSCGHDCPQKPHRITKKPGDVDHPGNLPDYCPTAGPRRNRAMVGLGADVCVAFFKKGAANYGTSGCVKLAKAAGIVVKPVSG